MGLTKALCDRFVRSPLAGRSLLRYGHVRTPFGRLYALDWNWAVRAMALGEWEPLETRVFTELARGATVWDIGGHYGWYVLVSLLAGARRVCVAEASPATFALLEQTIAGSPRVTAVKAAVVGVGSPKMVSFFEACDSVGGLCSSVRQSPDAVRRIEVPALSIKELICSMGWPQPDLVKMDIEGAEVEVLPETIGLVGRAASLVFEVNFEAIARYGVLPFALLETVQVSRDVCFRIDERDGVLKAMRGPEDVRHGENILAVSNSVADRLASVGFRME